MRKFVKIITGPVLVITVLGITLHHRSTLYSPSGFDLHGVGLEPDVEIPFEYPEELGEDEELTDEMDNQLQKGMEVLQEMMK